MSTTAGLLRAFADLAPAGAVTSLDVTSAYGPFVWIGVAGDPALAFSTPHLPAQAIHVPNSRGLRRLAGLDALHRDERLLRLGWVFLAGAAEVDGERRRVCLPLLSQPVRLGGRVAGVVHPAGDSELLPLLDDPQVAAELEQQMAFGGGALRNDMSPDLLARLPFLTAWIHDVSAAAGLAVGEVLPPGEDPRRHVAGERLVAVVGLGLYAARDVAAVGLGSSLRAWAGVPGVDGTAFGALYGAAPSDAEVDAGAPVHSPLPLTGAQADVVRRARTAPVTVVSGAPGNGKSHALVAAAIDEVGRGNSVLVATQSLHAAEVLADLFDRYPGPTPVVFGSSEQRETLATRLAAGLPQGPGRREVAAAVAAVESAAGHVDAVRATIAGALDAERLAGRSAQLAPLAASLSALAPAAFAPGTDHDRLALLLGAVADESVPGWWARRRRRRALRRVRRAFGAAGDVPTERLELALQAARARRAAAELAAHGGTTIGAAWDELADAEAGLAGAAGALVDARVRAVSGSARRGAAALGAALRAGRGRRREMLARMDGPDLVAALPLWVGTLRDIEDLLPRTPGLFDLVILDEASQIDQLRAAPALLRGQRAVVAGDPRQLRHVSFVADLDVAAALEEHGLDALADRLDVRRASALDTAATVAATTWLDEHFRSVPHLIAFSAGRFYPQPVRLVTMHPRSEGTDAIDVVRVGGRRQDGVNAAEVEAVADVLRDLRGTERSIAVVSPFRAQADALEDMILAGYDVDAIARLGLTAGTVHELQGNERDVVVVSLALSDADPSGARRFVEDPNLFNVMVTRARRRLVVVTSLPVDAGGLIGEYLAHAATPPAPPDAAGAGTAWTRAVHDEVLAGGRCAVRGGYPVGRWSVDLCVGAGEAAVAVDTEVHEGGAGAHIERHRTLRAAGWRTADAFPTRYDGDAVRAAVELAALARRAARGAQAGGSR